MDRYELNKSPQQEKNPEEVIESKPKRKNPNVEPMEVQLCFHTGNSQWYVKIKKLNEGNQNWETVYGLVNGIRSEIIFFDTAVEAQEWCEQKGLL